MELNNEEKPGARLSLNRQEKGTGKRFLTVDDVCGMLQVPKSWIYERARRGTIPVVPNMGKYVRFDPDVLEKYFSTNGLWQLKSVSSGRRS